MVKKSYLSRKENIILTAVEIMEESGVAQVTIREIARRQGVSEAAIYRHFQSKEEIILGVLERFAAFDRQIMETILAQKMGFAPAVIFYCHRLAEYYENYPAMVSVLLCSDLFYHEEQAARKWEEIHRHRFDFLIRLAKDALASGRVTDGWQAEDLADLVTGFLKERTRRWKADSFAFSLAASIAGSIQQLLACIAPPEQSFLTNASQPGPIYLRDR